MTTTEPHSGNAPTAQPPNVPAPVNRHHDNNQRDPIGTADSIDAQEVTDHAIH